MYKSTTARVPISQGRGIKSQDLGTNGLGNKVAWVHCNSFTDVKLF